MPEPWGLSMNINAYTTLQRAYELAVRNNELYEAIKLVESCGASPELTAAVVKLGWRRERIQQELRAAYREAGGDDA